VSAGRRIGERGETCRRAGETGRRAGETDRRIGVSAGRRARETGRRIGVSAGRRARETGRRVGVSAGRRANLPIYFSPLRVRAAFFADADLLAAERLLAAVRACRDKASGEAAAPLSRWRAFNAACDRLAEGFFPESAFSRSSCALCRVASEVSPGFGGANFTPARRALESPMAIACFVERARCFPARISSISSRTNSPACVEADFPSRSSRRARSMVCFLGMIY
jgi:hypothetical protein